MKYKYGSILYDKQMKSCFTYRFGYTHAIVFDFIGRYSLATQPQIDNSPMEEDIEKKKRRNE